jgi:hypothetical protein
MHGDPRYVPATAETVAVLKAWQRGGVADAAVAYEYCKRLLAARAAAYGLEMQ